MKNIVVLYPGLFTCYSKFSRKLSRILQNIDEGMITFPHDQSGFIQRYFHNGSYSLTRKEDWHNASVTQGIIFDDGEEFPSEAAFFKEQGLPVRVVPIKITRVMNIRNDSRFQGVKSTSIYEYIGRGSYWGNPYSMHEDGEDREEVIKKFRYDFERDIFPNKQKNEVYKLAGKRLGCFCKPDACHGDVLADYLNSWDDGE